MRVFFVLLEIAVFSTDQLGEWGKSLDSIRAYNNTTYTYLYLLQLWAVYSPQIPQASDLIITCIHLLQCT